MFHISYLFNVIRLGFGFELLLRVGLLDLGFDELELGGEGFVLLIFHYHGLLELAVGLLQVLELGGE